MAKVFIAVLILSLAAAASAQALNVVHARVLQEKTRANVPAPHTAMGVSKAAGDALALSYALAQADDLATALAAYDATRRAAGNEIKAYGRRLGASFI
jgi:hypothetical protein